MKNHKYDEEKANVNEVYMSKQRKSIRQNNKYQILQKSTTATGKNFMKAIQKINTSFFNIYGTGCLIYLGCRSPSLCSGEHPNTPRMPETTGSTKLYIYYVFSCTYILTFSLKGGICCLSLARPHGQHHCSCALGQ